MDVAFTITATAISSGDDSNKSGNAIKTSKIRLVPHTANLHSSEFECFSFRGASDCQPREEYTPNREIPLELQKKTSNCLRMASEEYLVSAARRPLAPISTSISRLFLAA